MNPKGWLLMSLIPVMLLLYGQLVAAQPITHADDENESGDMTNAIGIAGGAFFGLAALSGLVIRLNRLEPFRQILIKMGIQNRLILKVHHPLTLLSLILCSAHGALSYFEGYGELTQSGVVIAWGGVGAMLLLSVTGATLPYAKQNRKPVRYIHFVMTFLAAAITGIHVLSAED